MIDVFYINSKNEKLNLRGPDFIITNNNDLGNWEWTYEVSNGVIKQFEKKFKEKSLQLLVKGKTKDACSRLMNALYEKTEIDICTKTPGKLYVGDYYLECYLISKDIDNSIIGKNALETLKIMPVGKVWLKKHPFHFSHTNEPIQSGHGYPHDYPYGYSIGTGYSATVTNEGFTDSNMIITIYGYAYHPEILIDGHSYKINCIVDSNQKAVINTRDRTIRLINLQSGVVKNAFMFREQSSNIFEKISPGEHTVFWNTNFNFDITILIERSEPEWL